MTEVQEEDSHTVYYHWDEADLLRQHIAGGLPQGSSPLDGDFYIEQEPCAPDKLQLDLGSYDPEGYFKKLEEYRARAREHGRTYISISYHPKEKHYFFVQERQLIEQVKRLWAEQMEVVGHEIEFTVEATGAWDPKDRKVCRYVSLTRLFAEDGLPEAFREGSTKSENTTALVVSLDDAPEIKQSRVEQTRSEVEAWLAAYTLCSGVGLRILEQVVRPLRRRFLPWQIGPQHTVAPQADSESLEPTKKSWLEDSEVWTALRGLSVALSAPDDQACLVALWGTVEKSYDKPEKEKSLLTKAEKGRINKFLRDLLGREKAKKVYDYICELKMRSKNERIASALNEIVPRRSVEEWLRIVRDASEKRARATHNVRLAQGKCPEIAPFIEGLVALVDQKLRKVSS